MTAVNPSQERLGGGRRSGLLSMLRNLIGKDDLQNRNLNEWREASGVLSGRAPISKHALRKRPVIADFCSFVFFAALSLRWMGLRFIC